MQVSIRKVGLSTATMGTAIMLVASTLLPTAFADAKKTGCHPSKGGTKVPTQHLRTAAAQTNKVLVPVSSKVAGTKDSKT